MSHASIPPTVCPVCGESVPRDARACPGCGADERSGWNGEATRYDGLDLPDEAFDEASERTARRQHTRGLWPLIGLGLLILLIFTLIF
ncbi:MAG: zinc ribbon domain-containing protein [Lacunisphaera sp.]|nr:zinc ribbon domain-containing protein [Lacunisphaera sp.]